MQRSVAVEVGDGLGAAAVQVEHGDVGPGAIESPVAVGVELRRLDEAVLAGRDNGAVLHRPAGTEIDQGLDAGAVRRPDDRLRLVDAAVAVGVAGDRYGQSVGAGGGDGAVLERSVGIEAGDGLGGAAVRVDPLDPGPVRSNRPSPSVSDCVVVDSPSALVVTIDLDFSVPSALKAVTVWVRL